MRKVNLDRRQLSAFLGSPETIRAFENLASNGDESVDAITAIQGSPTILLAQSDAFTNGRVITTDGEVEATDGGPGGNYTLGLSDTGVTAGDYGSEAKSVKLRIDAKGRVEIAQEFDLVTDNVEEGAANLYFTTARARNALSGGTGISYTPASGVIALDPDYIASGLYTPTFTVINNIAQVVAHRCYYHRIGSIVSVTGAMEIRSTAAGSYSDLNISIPVPSVFTIQDNAWGTLTSNTNPGTSGAVSGVAGGKVVLSYIPVVNTLTFILFEFKYEVV